MARRLAWSNVRGGLIAIAVIVGVAAATLKYARVGALRGDRMRLYAAVGAARGVLKGSEVWLLGQKVGKITDIRCRSPSESDTTSRVLIEMEVLEKYRVSLHRDAEAQVRTGGSVIGAMVVYLTPGSANAPPIRDGDTLRAKPQSEVESAAARFGARKIESAMSGLAAVASRTTNPTSRATATAPMMSVDAEVQPSSAAFTIV